MCYSLKGNNRTWVFPKTWNKVRSADIYLVTPDTITLKEANRNIADHSIKLTLKAGECVSIVPHGTDIHRIRTIYELPASGIVTLNGQDRNTKGNWVGVYGRSGYDVIGGKRKLSSNINLNYIGNNLETWASNPTDIWALYSSSKKEERVAAGNTATLHEIIDVGLKNSVKKKVALYFLDQQHYHRQILVDVIDPNTKRVLRSDVLSNFDNGIYLKYTITGHVQFRLTRFFYDGYKDPNYPTFSGVFFD